jgi:hypothetical protein
MCCALYSLNVSFFSNLEILTFAGVHTIKRLTFNGQGNILNNPERINDTFCNTKRLFPSPGPLDIIKDEICF